jgi:dTDP-4-dehydrorhamnose 3,5-epimerase
MIEGVTMKQLRRIVDERGYLMEILRSDEGMFRGFGQAYISACFPGMVKAWHCHEVQYDHFCCVSGNLKVGLYDDRDGSATEGQTGVLVVGELNPELVCIPPRVWHGFMAVGGHPAVVLNIPTEVYRYDCPDELRRDAFDPEIPFVWKREGW